MNQQQRLAGSGLPIGDTLSVQIEILHLAHVNRSPSDGVPACWHNVIAIAPTAPSRQYLNLRFRRLPVSKVTAVGWSVSTETTRQSHAPQFNYLSQGSRSGGCWPVVVPGEQRAASLIARVCLSGFSLKPRPADARRRRDWRAMRRRRL